VGSLVGIGQVLNYAFGDGGSYVIVLEVIDVNGLSGFDSTFVTVEYPPVPAAPATWGYVQSLYQ